MILYLVYIYYRKYFEKDDYLTLSIFVLLLSYFVSFVLDNYHGYRWLLLLFLISISQHHFGRKDLYLLKTKSYFKIILASEYLSLFIFVPIVFLMKEDYILLLIYIFSAIFIAFVPQITFRIRLPFHLFSPFWNVTFRKHKWYLGFPLSLSFIILGYFYDNQNLALAGIGTLSIIGVIPAFEREFRADIVFSAYLGRQYLYQQIKNTLFNFSIIFLPIEIFFLILHGISSENIIFSILFLSLPIVGIFAKYAFFDDITSQTILTIAVFSGFFYGISLLFIPLLYLKSINKIKEIQYAYY